MKNHTLTIAAVLGMLIVITTYSTNGSAQTTIQKKSKDGSVQAEGANLPVQGSGKIGRLAKWTALTSSNSFIGDSTIFEDKFGQVGIGTDSPTSKLTVLGTVETTAGGYKFPDGTVQTTAGVAPSMVVQSLNGLGGDVTLQAGSNISITPVGNMLTIASTAKDPAANAFQRVLQLDMFNGSIFEKDFDPTAGSAGLRFVIEYLSISSGPEAKDIQMSVTVNGTETWFPFKWETGTGVLDRSLRLYFDGNTKITIQAARASTNTIDGVTVHMSGYTVPIP